MNSTTMNSQCIMVELYDKVRRTYEVFLSTDIELSAQKIEKYYRLRYQIEFLFRDGKQHGWLRECQARSARKINFHIDLVLTNIDVAKAIYHFPVPKEKRGSFSLENIKRIHHTKLITDLIFSNLALDMSCKKI